MPSHIKAIKFNKKKKTDRAPIKHWFLLQHINNLYLFKRFGKKKVTAALWLVNLIIYMNLTQLHIGITSWILQLQATEEMKRIYLVNIWPVIKYIYVGRI